MTTYATLKSDIAGWLLRDDLTSAIPSFIRLAEASIRRDVRIRQMIRTYTLTLSAQSQQLPEDFLEMERAVVDSSTAYALKYMPPSALFSSSAYHDSGEPTFYTIEGDYFITAPDATGSDVLLSYYKAFSSLTNDTDTNWLLTNAYDVYLYGSLAHAAPYIKEDSRVTLWNAGYMDAVSKLNKAERRSMFAGGPLAVRSVGGP